MSNKSALRFLKRLIAAKCPKFKPDAETQQEYLEKLDRWMLSDVEWEMALEILTDDKNLGEGLPQLSDIYDVLKQVTKHKDEKQNGGWMLFDFGNYRYSLRIESVNGEWLWAPMEYYMNREKIVIQKHPEMPAKAPNGSTEVHIIPDHPALFRHEPEIPGNLDDLIKQLVNEEEVPF